MTEQQHVRTELADRVLTVTLDRPDKLNAFTLPMLQQMIAAFDRADADDEVRAVVVTGAGRAFCAGADLSAGGATFDYENRADRPAPGTETDPRRDGGGLVALRIFESTKPVIGAINGAAVGVGATMTLPMDVRLASTTTRYGFVFARRGIVPEAASSWFLPRLVGISKAVEWAMTGRIFDASEALAGGLVRSVHEPADLLTAAYALAREIADNTAPVSVALARQMMWRMLGADHPMEAHRVDSRAMIERGRSGDAIEGVSSFLEKRAAVFPDRVSDGLGGVHPWWPERPFTPLPDREQS
jgi:enoyl-CoA hydratase/carnithine racemase